MNNVNQFFLNVQCIEMDIINSLTTKPAWAYTACYYYFFVAGVIGVLGVISILQLILMPNASRNLLAILTTSITLVISIAFSAVLVLMQFWICRAALKEKFAVSCKDTGDCEAVMGKPQGELCTCGARGLCGGCAMRNNMEPTAEFSAMFA